MMKTIFNKQDQLELRQRLEKLTPHTKHIWGKMNVAQMLAHCSSAMKLPTEELKPALKPIRFIGQFFKKGFLGNKPFGKNSPTSPELVISDARVFEKEKANLLEAFDKLTKGGEAIATAQQHPFFGKMSPAEWGVINYKHLDHHLQQFGV
jgi:hypothetical protein